MMCVETFRRNGREKIHPKHLEFNRRDGSCSVKKIKLSDQSSSFDTCSVGVYRTFLARVIS